MKFRFLFFLVFFFNSLKPDTESKQKDLSLRTIYKGTNIRKGPGYDYPIFFKIKNTKNYPLKPLLSYGDWIKVIDFENSIGWVYKNLVTTKNKSIIFIEKSYLYDKKDESSKKICLIGKNNTAILLKPGKKFSFISINGIKGWVKNKNFWKAE